MLHISLRQKHSVSALNVTAQSAISEIMHHFGIHIINCLYVSMIACLSEPFPHFPPIKIIISGPQTLIVIDLFDFTHVSCLKVTGVSGVFNLRHEATNRYISPLHIPGFGI